MDFRGAGASQVVQNIELFENSDRAWRQKPATHLFTRKPVSLDGNGFDSRTRQFSQTGGPGKAGADDQHIDGFHFSATSTRRNGKLRTIRPGTWACREMSSSSEG